MAGGAEQEERRVIKKIICINGKTMRGNRQSKEKPTHIVSVWSKEDGFCLGQKAVKEKSKEITTIPELLEKLQMKGQIVTIDAMGTQKGLVERIRSKRTEYVLAVRGHWSVENMHWHLNVTFKEDANTTIDKTAAQNQNIIRKWYLSILKMAELSFAFGT